MKKIKNYVDGRLFSSSHKTLPVDDPTTGEIISEVVLSDENDFKNVLNSSQKAFNIWSEITPLKR